MFYRCYPEVATGERAGLMAKTGPGKAENVGLASHFSGIYVTFISHLRSLHLEVLLTQDMGMKPGSFCYPSTFEYRIPLQG